MVARPAVDRSVTAVDRTLSILDAFADGNGVRSLSELEAHTGLFKSVICRYMLSFEKCGYLHKRDDGRYQLGAQIMRLGRSYDGAFNVAEHVLPILRALVDQTQESASFYVREADKRLCLYRIDSPFSLRVTVQPGSLLPIDDSATGQVFTRFAKGYDAMRHTDPKGFLRTSSNNTHTDMTASMSLPIFRLDNDLAGALTVSGPCARFDPDTHRVARQALAQHAQALSDAFGATLVYPEGTGWYEPVDTQAPAPRARRTPRAR